MQRLLYLDALRGIAALMVVILHGILTLEENISIENFSYWFVKFVDIGKIGVVIFFAISGFVIPWSLERKGSLRKFWKSRFFRLYPTYWLSIFLALAFCSKYTLDKIDFATLLANLTMVQQYFGFPNILGVYWTLAIEMVFYVIISFLFYKKIFDEKIFFKSSILFLLIALFLSLARWFFDKKLPVALPLALSIMFMSALLQKIVIEGKKIQKYVKNYLILFALLIPIISFLAYNKNMGYDEVWYRYTLSYFIALMIFFSVVLFWKISNKVLVFLGEISYSIYLFHLIIIDKLKYMLDLIKNNYGLLSAITIFLLVVIIVSTIIHYTVERPFMHLGREQKTL